MSWILKVTLVFITWFLVLLILLGVFNPQSFHCNHSIYWREMLSVCSAISLVEGILATLILVLLKNYRLFAIALSLILIVVTFALLDAARNGFEIATIFTAFTVSYGWKILGVIIGLYFAKLWSRGNS